MSYIRTVPKTTAVVLFTYFKSVVRVQLGGTGTHAMMRASGRATLLFMPSLLINLSGTLLNNFTACRVQ